MRSSTFRQVVVAVVAVVVVVVCIATHLLPDKEVPGLCEQQQQQAIGDQQMPACEGGKGGGKCYTSPQKTAALIVVLAGTLLHNQHGKSRCRRV